MFVARCAVRLVARVAARTVARGAVFAVATSLAGAGLAASEAPVFETRGEGAEECVVLLHGLARTAASMARLGARLRDAGYATVAVDYPSRKFPVADLAAMTVPAALDACADAGATTVHAVTHSLGGIVLRRHLDEHEEAAFGRAVMLAPPNRGSEVVDALGGVPGFALLNGPAGLELGTGADDVPAQLGPATVDVAVITGRKTFNPILSQWLPNPDDGKVSVASARLDGMCAFLVVDVSHPFVMKDAAVIDEVIAYLDGGRFLDPAAEHPGCAHRR